MRRSRYIRGKICFKLFQRWRLIAKLFVGCCNAEEHRKSICRLLKHGRHIKKLLLAVATRKTHWKIDTTISRRGWTIKRTLTICHSSPILVIDWIQFSIAYIKCKLNVRNDKKVSHLVADWMDSSLLPLCSTKLLYSWTMYTKGFVGRTFFVLSVLVVLLFAALAMWTEPTFSVF